MCVYGVERVRGEGMDKSPKGFRIGSKSTGLALSMNIKSISCFSRMACAIIGLLMTQDDKIYFHG